MCLLVWAGALSLDGLGPNLATERQQRRGKSSRLQPTTLHAGPSTMDWTQRRSELLRLLRSDGQQPDDDNLGRLVERALVRQGKRRAGPSLPCCTSPNTSDHPFALYRSCSRRRRVPCRDGPGLRASGFRRRRPVR